MIKKLMMLCVAAIAATGVWADPEFGFWVEMHDVPAQTCSCIEHRIGKNHYVMTRLGALEGGKGTYVAIPVYGLDSELRDEDVFVTAGTYKDAGSPFVWQEEKMWAEYGQYLARAYESGDMCEDIWDDDDIHWADDCDNEFSPQILDRDYLSGDATSVLYFMSRSGPWHELISGIWDDWKPVLGRQWIIVPTPKASSVGESGKITSFYVTIKVGSQYYFHIVEGVDGTSLRKYKSSNDIATVGAVAVPFNAGTVSGNGEYKNDSTVTLKATASKGYVFSHWDGPIDKSQNPRNPSISYVVGEDDAEFVAYFIPVSEDWLDVWMEMDSEYTTGAEISDIHVEVESGSLATLKFKGLPSGLKYTAKAIYDRSGNLLHEANTIYGTPTKSGIYTVEVTATTASKKTSTSSAVIVVRKENEKMVKLAIQDWHDEETDTSFIPGKVFGGGILTEGKKVSLKATANKGFVFAGWWDVANDDWFYGSEDYRNPTLSYVMTDSDVELEAVFAPIAEDNILELYIEGECITANADDTVFDADGEVDVKLEIDSLSLHKASVSGLPKGLKFDAKTNMITGMPTAPGLYTATVKLTNQSIRKAIEKKFTISVSNLTAANDYFVDEYFGYDGNATVDGRLNLSVGITNIDDFLPSLRMNSPTAKLAVSGLPAGLKYDAKTGKITGIATKPGTYTVMLTVIDGKAKYVSTITIEVEALPDWVVGTFDGDSLGECAVPGSDYLGVSSLSVSSVGKITGKISFANAKTIPFTFNGFSAIENSVYIARGVVKAGYIEYAAEIKVGRSVYSSSEDVVYKGGADILMEANSNTDEGVPSIVECELEQNIWSSKNYSLPILDTQSTFYVAPDTDSEETFSIKFGNKGVATVGYWADLSLSKMTKSGSVPVILVEYDSLNNIWHGQLVLNSITNVGIDNESPVLIDVYFDENGNVSFSCLEVSPMPLSWFAGTYTGSVYEDGILGSYSGYITAKIDAKGTISAVMDWDSGVRRNIKCTCVKMVSRDKCRLIGKVNFYGYTFDVSIVINIDGTASMRAEAPIDTIWGNNLYKQ